MTLANQSRLLKRFEAMIAPLSIGDFLTDYFGRKPLHIKGSPERVADVTGLDRLEELLNMVSIWDGDRLKMVLDKDVLPPEAYCLPALAQNRQTILRPHPPKVRALLTKGASLVLNDIDMLGADITETAGAIEAAVGAKVQANLYFSRRQRPGFTSHFDTHDVFALHCRGTKVWNVYATRADHPIAHPSFAFDERDRGELLMRAEMEPGDLLYLPRGQYHDALAEGDGVIHVAFGATYPIGLDLIGLIHERAVQSPEFRTNLPNPAISGEAGGLRRHLAGLGRTIAAMLADDATLTAVTAQMADWHYQRDLYDMTEDLSRPPIAAEPTFRLTGTTFSLARQGGRTVLSDGKRGATLSAAVVPLVDWVLKKREFAASEFTRAFPTLPEDRRTSFFADMVRMRVLEEG